MRLWNDINQLTFVFPFAETRSIKRIWRQLNERIRQRQMSTNAPSRSIEMVKRWSRIQDLDQYQNLTTCSLAGARSNLPHDLVKIYLSVMFWDTQCRQTDTCRWSQYPTENTDENSGSTSCKHSSRKRMQQSKKRKKSCFLDFEKNVKT